MTTFNFDIKNFEINIYMSLFYNPILTYKGIFLDNTIVNCKDNYRIITNMFQNEYENDSYFESFDFILPNFLNPYYRTIELICMKDINKIPNNIFRFDKYILNKSLEYYKSYDNKNELNLIIQDDIKTNYQSKLDFVKQNNIINKEYYIKNLDFIENINKFR